MKDLENAFVTFSNLPFFISFCFFLNACSCSSENADALSINVSVSSFEFCFILLVFSFDIFSFVKSETGVLNKRNLVLKELGGKFENEYAVSVLGNAASLVFYENDLVVVTLRFQTREFNGQTFQDIVATDIVKINA